MPARAPFASPRPRHDLLTAEEERELARRIAEGDRAARDRLVGCNLAFARGLAAKYQGRGLDFEDLEQHARLGLLDAAERFDPDRARFTTFATWHVRRRLNRALQDEPNLIRLPSHVHAARSFVARGLPVPEREVLPENLPATLVLAERALSCRAGRVVAEDGEPDPIGQIPGREPEGDDDGPVLPIDADHLPGLLAQLKPRSAEVLRLRFGLGGVEPQTLEEVGARIGRSRQRVCQIEARALADLRKLAERQAAPSSRVPTWPGEPPPRPAPAPAPDPFPPAPQETPTVSTAALADPPPRRSDPEPVEGPRKSRFRGVCWNKNRWQVQICTPNGTKYVGSYADEQEAARSYDRKARELLGDKAKLNFPDDSPAPVPLPVAVAVDEPRKPVVQPRPIVLPLPDPVPVAPIAVAAPIPPAIVQADPELVALAAVAAALAGLDPDQVGRVLCWASARFGPSLASALPGARPC